MKFFKKDKIDFRIVVIGKKSFDYPKHLPIPRIGEKVGISEKVFWYYGVVVDVKHSIMSDNMSEIKIITEEIK